jgi:two-component system NtrC family sensor kinase
VTLPLRTRLALSIALVVVAMGVVSTIVGTVLFGDSLVKQVQRNVEQDLNAAYLVYDARLAEIGSEIRLTAADPEIVALAESGGGLRLAEALGQRMAVRGLDFLGATDASGIVIARGANPGAAGDDAAGDQVVGPVLKGEGPVSGTVIIDAEELSREAPETAHRVHTSLVVTPRARPTEREALEDGMALEAGVPIVSGNRLVGAVYGGILLNRREDIVDRVKRIAYAGQTWHGKDIGTATIFQDDVRIATNVIAPNGRRAIGTRVSGEVYDRVVGEGRRWIARAFVVDDWYITAYGPIRDPEDNVIGILCVGVRAAKFDALRARTVWTFAGVSVAGMVLAWIIASVLSSGIVRPVRTLLKASREIASGQIGVPISVNPNAAAELKELAESFDSMSRSVAERDLQLQENARKMTESKKLATLGQLAAGIAHEINNPLGGIVMYSHMLKEELQLEQNRENVEKIAKEADRCKRIVKGLLDFARQTKPERTESNINLVLNEVIALLEHQAIFHNIKILNERNQSLPLVNVDVAQMQEVFMNLILNAAQAMEGKAGTLTTVTRITPDRNAIEVEIRDTGPGIPQDKLDKIFEPFYTTKEVGRGTGLGLSIAYGIIERHHGSIRVESKVGKGTSFFVRIPIPETAPEM